MHDASQHPKIIYGVNWATGTYDNIAEEPIIVEPPKPKKKIDRIEVYPEEPMPEGYPDYRQILQRDGLFVYNYAIWKERELFVINWVKTCGDLKIYASEFCTEKELAGIMPTRTGDRGYWTKLDGEEPDRVIYAAPYELYVRRHLRPAYINKLRKAGIKINLDYNFTLTKAKKHRDGDKLQKLSTMDRFMGFLKQSTVNKIVTKPDTFLNEFEDLILAFDEDGTLERWGLKKKNKRKARKAY